VSRSGGAEGQRRRGEEVRRRRGAEEQTSKGAEECGCAENVPLRLMLLCASPPLLLCSFAPPRMTEHEQNSNHHSRVYFKSRGKL